MPEGGAGAGHLRAVDHGRRRAVREAARHRSDQSAGARARGRRDDRGRLDRRGREVRAKSSGEHRAARWRRQDPHDGAAGSFPRSRFAGGAIRYRRAQRQAYRGDRALRARPRRRRAAGQGLVFPTSAPVRTKRRADQLLVERGLAESRAKAQALILAGIVYAGERRIDKGGESTAVSADIEVRGRDHPWVSRGGVKLAHALEHFAIDVTGFVALDIGASTGGFVDVLLTRSAARAHAVDVGRGQLAWKLRQDPRVVIHDGVNARYLTAAEIPEPVDIITCDASFIGLATVLPAALALAKPHALLVALVKPQFEAGPGAVGKGGVVRDPEIHRAVCDDASEWVNARSGWSVVGITDSPITGPAGNREFLLCARRG